MGWRENRDLLFWYYVVWTIVWVFIPFVVFGVYHVLSTQQVR